MSARSAVTKKGWSQDRPLKEVKFQCANRYNHHDRSYGFFLQSCRRPTMQQQTDSLLCHSLQRQLKQSDKKNNQHFADFKLIYDELKRQYDILLSLVV